MVTLYNVISADGYIARKDGSEDFIPESYWPHTLRFLEQFDCIMLGRNTYETIQGYEKEMRDSFDNLAPRKVIITKDINFHPREGYETAHVPEKVLESNLNIVVTSGPTLNQYLIESGLVDRITVHKVPESIGEGIKPYENTNTIPVMSLETF